MPASLLLRPPIGGCSLLSESPLTSSPDRSLARVKAGLRLLQVCLLIPLLGILPDVIFGDALSPDMKSAAAQFTLVLSILGTVACLAAPAGRVPLAICLALGVEACAAQATRLAPEETEPTSAA